MGSTSIQWTDHSVNPIRARDAATNKVGHFCQKISPGCANCYASSLQPRFGLPRFKGAGAEMPDLELGLDEKKLQEVLRRRMPTRIFWCDMTDLFLAHHPDEWLDRIFATMALTPQHTHQVLTKRPERMLAYLRMLEEEKDMQRWANAAGNMGLSWKDPEDWPLPNVWLGVSVEDQQRKTRIDVLRQVPAALRFLSLEPLLEDLGTLDLSGIGWVIIGGESGHYARPCNIDWLRPLVQQCQAAGVAAFVKQLGRNACCGDKAEERLRHGRVHPELLEAMRIARGGYLYETRDRKGGNPAEWPLDLQVRQFPEAVRV